MIFFSKRRKEFEECVDNLEERIKSLGIRETKPHFYFFRDSRVLNALSLGPFLSFFVYYPDYPRQFKDVRRLIKKFKEKRYNANLDFDVFYLKSGEFLNLHKRLEEGYVDVGIVSNPDYNVDKAESIKCQVNQLSNNSTYQYYKSEMGKTSCGICHGSGHHGTGQSGIGDVTCESCGGTGRENYEPQISEEDMKIVWSVERELGELEEKLWSYSKKDIRVFVKLK